MASEVKLKFSLLKGFPALSNNKILTSEFLEASREVVGLIGKCSLTRFKLT